MTIANQCPDCGRTDPVNETDTYVDDDGPITYICEDFYCACGAQVGGFAHPQV